MGNKTMKILWTYKQLHIIWIVCWTHFSFPFALVESFWTRLGVMLDAHSCNRFFESFRWILHKKKDFST